MQIENNNPIGSMQNLENTKRHPQWFVLIILVLALVLVASGVALLKKPAVVQSSDENPVTRALNTGPIKEISETQKKIILDKLSEEPPQAISDEQKAKILESLSK